MGITMPVHAKGRGLKSYRSGQNAAATGKTYRDNPYLYCRVGQGGKTLSEWWRLGFDSMLRIHGASSNFEETID